MNPLEVSADEFRKVLARVAELCADSAAAIVDLPRPSSSSAAPPNKGRRPSAIEAIRDMLEHSRPPSHAR